MLDARLRTPREECFARNSFQFFCFSQKHYFQMFLNIINDSAIHSYLSRLPGAYESTRGVPSLVVSSPGYAFEGAA